VAEGVESRKNEGKCTSKKRGDRNGGEGRGKERGAGKRADG